MAGAGGAVAVGLGEVDPDTHVYPRSTTIGDYTLTPTAVTASSEGTSTDPAASLASGKTAEIGRFNINNTQTRIGNKISTGHALIGKTVRGILFRIKRTGTLSGTVYARVYNSANTLVATLGSMDVSSIATSSTDYTFNNGASSAVIANGDYICLEYTGADAVNLLEITYNAVVANIVASIYTGSWTDQAEKLYYEAFGDATVNYPATNANDGNTATYHKTNSEANPYEKHTLSASADKEVAAIAIWIPAGINTITTLKISLSPDDATYTLMRAILISALTAGAWNYIRMKRDVQQNRYLKIHSTDTGVLAVTDVQVLAPTESQWNRRQGNKDITTESTEGVDA